MCKTLFLGLIDFYQKHLRMFLPCSCRFEPSCSQYSKQAVQKYGLYKGMIKSASRILSCHPFSGRSGWDPLI